MNLAIALLLSSTSPAHQDCPRTVQPGRYVEAAAPVTRVVYIRSRYGIIDFRPSDWTSGTAMVEVAPDSFGVPSLARFGMKAIRDSSGCVRSLRTFGFGFSGDLRPTTAPPFAIEEVYDGDVRRGTAGLLASLDSVQAGQLGQILLRFPSKASRAVAFLNEAVTAHPGSADLFSTLGDAYLATGDRPRALQAYGRAHQLDSAAEWPVSAIRMLTADTLRRTLVDSLLLPPRPEEIAQVRAGWAARDLTPTGVSVVREYDLTLGGVRSSVRVIRHTVRGDAHYGVAIIPAGAVGAPIVVEAKGVSPTFFPLDVTELTTTSVLGRNASRVITIAPSYRGERLIVASDTFTSEGDRSEVWDGATDDLLAFLNVAKRTIPEADTSRVCVFGRSRGGTVALLASIRDPSIRCTVAWAAPTDWFELMGQGGWTIKQSASEALRRSSATTEIGGQFLHTFLRKVAAGEETLAEARSRLIASSPLYFAESIGCVQAHWGMRDLIVPVRNGERFTERARAAGCYEPLLHEVAGHDQDRILAPILSSHWLMSYLFPGPEPSPR
jgi:hypothetical protein